jgi:hypothetical protein
MWGNPATESWRAADPAMLLSHRLWLLPINASTIAAIVKSAPIAMRANRKTAATGASSGSRRTCDLAWSFGAMLTYVAHHQPASALWRRSQQAGNGRIIGS